LYLLNLETPVIALCEEHLLRGSFAIQTEIAPELDYVSLLGSLAGQCPDQFWHVTSTSSLLLPTLELFF
jgi:hypothetical protein